MLLRQCLSSLPRLYLTGNLRENGCCEPINVEGDCHNIGSVEGHAANPHHTAYCASKAGVHGLIRAMAVDLGQYAIRCNAIAPGWIESQLNGAYVKDRKDPQAARQALQAMHPIGPAGVPRDIGDLAVYLAGDSAGFLTGQVLVVDGAGAPASWRYPFPIRGPLAPASFGLGD